MDTVGGVSDHDAAEVPDQLLRSALEFAVGIAAAGVKLRPPLPVPSELKRFLRFHKLPATALHQVREAVEGDDDFRKRLASVATDELVDEIGLLWLSRPDGWVDTVCGLLPEAAADDEQAAIRREERRRHAAQEAAARARAELLVLSNELERERAGRADLVVELTRLRAELDEVRQRLREAQRVEHATAQALAKAEDALSRAHARADVAEATAAEQTSIDADKLRAIIEAALVSTHEVATRLAGALEEVPAEQVAEAMPVAAAVPRVARRKALPLPGGVLKGSPESAEAWLRTAGAKVLVDGYNVAKLGWPTLDLDHQREQCIRAAENLSKRWNLTLMIVFDGASVQGAHTSTRRGVRIVYSPEGVSADDVLRAEVAAADPEQPLIVITNDRAIITDVADAGANTVSSDVFLSLTH